MKFPISLTKRGWGFTLGAAACCVMWLILQLRDIWYLVAFFTALPLLAIVWSLVIPLFARFFINLDGPAKEPSVGEHCVFVATVMHNLDRALSVTLDWHIGEETYTSHSNVPGRRAATSTVPVFLGRRGPFKVSITHLRVSDPLGLAVRRVGISASCETLVLPVPLERVPGLDRRSRYGQPFDVSLSSSVTDAPGTPAGSVRDYRSGDALRQIHWKQSARQGQLLVNLFEREYQEDRLLLLVTTRSCYKSPAEFETAVSAAATIATNWIASARPVYLHTGKGPAEECRTPIQALQQLALVQMTRAPVSASKLPKGGVHGVVTGSVTPELSTQLRSMRFRGSLWTIRTTSSRHNAAPWSELPVIEPERASRG